MVVCKFFQQGNCRFGQYCRFEHIGGFAAGPANRDSKSIVLGVAEEVLAAERGGQWLLSCFGPFKEGACIPGMEDVSPEEVRWEMYQAQKNSTVDQTKLQFQQLCQTMATKREALKNPTIDTADMLEKLHKNNSGFQQKSNFVLGTPQLGGASMPAANVFAQKQTFGTASGTFGGGFTATPVSQPSIFGRPSGNSTFFGAAPSFGAFAPQSSNSIFGAAKPGTSVFGGSQPMPGFGSSPSANPASAVQTTASFNTGGTQNPFSSAQTQPSIFSATQSTSVFGGATTSPFSSQSQTGSGPFGGGASVFGGTQGQSAFGGNSNIFGQKNPVAFASAPVFGVNAGGFGAVNSGVFGGQGTFTSSGNAFGQTTTTSSFSAAALPSSTFAPASVQPQNLTSQGNPPPFGNPPVASNDACAFAGAGNQAAPFGSAPNVNNSAFGASVAPPENFANANPFMLAAPANPQVNPFLQNTQSAVDDVFDGSIYSNEGDLSESDLAAFRANYFTLRTIPIKPPTIEIR